MSTVHNSSTSVVKTKGGKEVTKPNIVLDYNNTMGCVDKADQELTYYPVMRKQQKRYIYIQENLPSLVGAMHVECLRALRKEPRQTTAKGQGRARGLRVDASGSYTDGISVAS